MAPFSNPSDVEILLQRPLTDEEYAATKLHLAGASSIIRAVVTDVDDRLTAGSLDQDLVDYVAASMVLRVLRNPEGLLSESIDDYEFRRDAATSTGALELLDDETALLKTRRRGAFTIRPSQVETTSAMLEEVVRFRALRACA